MHITLERLRSSISTSGLILQSNMSGGPSPVIPLLLVAALSVFLCWEDLLRGYEFITEIGDTTVALLVILPILALFAVQAATELILVPLAFFLVLFLLRADLIGPLLILLAVYLLGQFCYSSEKRVVLPPCWEPEHDDDGSGSKEEEEGGRGLGWFLFLILGVVTYAWFYEGEGYGWICILFGFTFIFYFNMM